MNAHLLPSDRRIAARDDEYHAWLARQDSDVFDEYADYVRQLAEARQAQS